MNIRNVCSVASLHNEDRIACSHYSDLDSKVIAKATELGLPLIGGTALELWANSLGVSGVRKRSDNDLDFITSDVALMSEFQEWCYKNIDASKVKVDVMLVKSHDFSKWQVIVDGVLVMKLEYLLWSKLTRGSSKDIQDIKWMLDISELSDESIQDVLDNLGLTQKEADLLTSLIS